MSATKLHPLAKRLAAAMLDAHCGATVSASWGKMVDREQQRRTRLMAQWLIEKLADHALELRDISQP